MKKNCKNFLFPLIVIWILGTLLHFVYDWTNQSSIVAIFGAINESVWEHGKLAFWPLAFYFLLQALQRKLSWKDAAVGAAVACWSAVITMIMLFYTYTGATGLESLVVDIGIFFFVTFIGLLFGKRAAAKPGKSAATYLFAAAAFLILFIAYLIFTFAPPLLPIFISAV